MLGALLDPWQDPINLRALVEVTLLGTTGGALGCWIVFYRLAYSAESLAHALLPGLVLAALAGAPLVLGGAVGLLVAAGALAPARGPPAVGPPPPPAPGVPPPAGLRARLAPSPGARRRSATTPPSPSSSPRCSGSARCLRSRRTPRRGCRSSCSATSWA